MPLDIATPLGQATLAHERKLIAAFHRTYPPYLYVETDKTRDAVNDGVIVRRKDNTMLAVVESKCRDMTVENLYEDWCGEWLITWRKVKECSLLARAMRVNLTGMLYCLKSNVVLMKQLYDGNKDVWLTDFRTANTETQRTVNGGRVVRENAFINMENALRFRV